MFFRYNIENDKRGMNEMDKKKQWTIAGACLILFCLLIVLLKSIDVTNAGPQGTAIGLSGINTAVHGWTGLNMAWYRITSILGYLVIAAAGILMLYSLYRAFRMKGQDHTARSLICLFILYLATAVLYVFFEKTVINWRPEILPGTTEPEASFPSTHTMLAIAVMGSAATLLPAMIKNRHLRIAAQSAAVTIMVLTVIGRLLSGVHWLTDILGGILLGAALVFAFRAVIGKKE